MSKHICPLCENKINNKEQFLLVLHYERKGKLKYTVRYHYVCFKEKVLNKKREKELMEMAGYFMGVCEKAVEEVTH